MSQNHRNRLYPENKSTLLNLSADYTLIDERITYGHDLYSTYIQGDKQKIVEMIRNGLYSVDTTIDVTYQLENMCNPFECGLNDDTYLFEKTVNYTGITFLHLAIQDNDFDFGSQLVDLGADLESKIHIHYDSSFQFYTEQGEELGLKSENYGDYSQSLLLTAIDSQNPLESLVFLNEVGFNLRVLCRNDFEFLEDYADSLEGTEVFNFVNNIICHNKANEPTLNLTDIVQLNTDELDQISVNYENTQENIIMNELPLITIEASLVNDAMSQNLNVEIPL